MNEGSTKRVNGRGMKSKECEKRRMKEQPSDVHEEAKNRWLITMYI